MTVKVVPNYDVQDNPVYDISQEEIESYVKRAEEKFGDKCKQLTIALDGEDVELGYELVNPPFERIRRITGYLVGTLDRWNDAKRAEEHERVKHGIA